MEDTRLSLKRDLRFLFFISGLLTLVGFVFIYSASSVYALEKFGSSFYFIKKQLIYLIPSFVGFIIFAMISESFLRKITPFLFLISLILTIMTLFPQFSLRMHGSSRWLSIGKFSFQPSEFLKLFLFIFLLFKPF